MLTLILILLVVLSAAVHIHAEYKGARPRIYIFKSLTMVLIGLIAILGQTTAPFYKVMVIAGLACSIVGDLFLVPPAEQFLAGMGAFFLAHLFYSVAFVAHLHGLKVWPLLPLLVYSVVVYRILAPSLGELKLPVCLYELVIMVMAWLAWERWLQMGQSLALLSAIGAVLFIISDTILVINRFRKTFKLACALNLITYFAAQCLIACSVGPLN